MTIKVTHFWILDFSTVICNKMGAYGPPELLKCGVDLSSEIRNHTYNEVNRSIDYLIMYIPYSYL